MLFNSIQFAIFLPIVFIIYWLLGKNLKLQNLFVVLASYVFYGWWDWRFLILIAFTSFCSWGSGLLVAKNNNQSPKPAVAEFCTCKAPVVAVYEYCNLHGLWVKEL